VLWSQALRRQPVLVHRQGGPLPGAVITSAAFLGLLCGSRSLVCARSCSASLALWRMPSSPPTAKLAGAGEKAGAPLPLPFRAPPHVLICAAWLCRGFGFVTMPAAEAGNAASQLNETEFMVGGMITAGGLEMGAAVAAADACILLATRCICSAGSSSCPVAPSRHQSCQPTAA
jgi:hypothetical protein